MKILISILILLIASSLPSMGQNINTPKLDSFLTMLAAKDMAMGTVAISQNGSIQYQKAIGYSSRTDNANERATINTTYKIGSTTKVFTAVMIFQLIEEGKIKSDQKLSLYFPDLPNANHISIHDLLYHRSGLHDYTKDTDFDAWMDQPKSQEELLQIIKGKGVDFDPGVKAEYSNSNYLVLGYIIEQICQMSYTDVLRKRITSRLKLKNTYSWNPVHSKGKVSASYQYVEGNWNKKPETDVSLHGGAGSIVSTPTEMVIFMDALFSNKLVSTSSLDAMKTMVDDYGMGMFSDKYGSKPSFGHNGRVEESYAALWHYPAEGISFAYCTNGIYYPRTDLIEGILKICFNEPFVIPFTHEIDIKEGDLNKYIGQYASGQIVVTCTKDGNQLFLETRGHVFEVERISGHYYMNAASGYFFEFQPDKGQLQVKETDNIYFLQKVD